MFNRSFITKILMAALCVAFVLPLFSTFTPTPAHAQKEYQPMITIGSESGIVGLEDYESNDINTFIGSIFQIGVSLAIILAVIMVIWGGIEYMTSETPFLKGEGRGRITAAIGGLILALSTIVIFNTINPQITKTRIETAELNLSKYGVEANPDVFDENLVAIEARANYLYEEYGIATTTRMDDGTTRSTGSVLNPAGVDEFFANTANIPASASTLEDKIEFAMNAAVANEQRICDVSLGGNGCTATLTTILIRAGIPAKVFTASTVELGSKLLSTGKFTEVSLAQARNLAGRGRKLVVVTERVGSRAGHAGWIGAGGQVTAFSSATGIPKTGAYTFIEGNANDWMTKIGNVRPGATRFFLPN